MASPVNGNISSANGALFELLSVYPQVVREDLNILYIMQDLLYTVQNIIAGIASVSQVYHEDEHLSKFEINLGKGRPLIMLQYKDTMDNNDADPKDLLNDKNDEVIPGFQQTCDKVTFVKVEDEVCLDTNSCVSETSEKAKANGKNDENDYYFDAVPVCKSELSSELTIVDSRSSEVENFNDYSENIFTAGAESHTEVEAPLSNPDITQDANDGINNFNLEQEIYDDKPENATDTTSVLNSATQSLSIFDEQNLKITWEDIDAQRKTERPINEMLSNFSSAEKIFLKSKVNSNTSDFESPTSLNLCSKKSLKLTRSVTESSDVYQAADTKEIKEKQKNLRSVKILKDKKQPTKCKIAFPPVSIFLCKFCEKSFHYLSQMQIHERVHTGEKPYACKYCDKTFSQRGSKKRHEQIHTDDNFQMWKSCASTPEKIKK